MNFLPETNLKPSQLDVDVATAGTAVPLSATPRWVEKAEVQAKDGNTQNIWLGDENVAANNGRQIASTQSRILENTDLSNWYIDSDVDAEGVIVIVEDKV